MTQPMQAFLLQNCNVSPKCEKMAEKPWPAVQADVARDFGNTGMFLQLFNPCMFLTLQTI
jgi:hypothetical protein